MIATHLALFSFLDGASGTGAAAPPSVPTASVSQAGAAYGYSGRRFRREPKNRKRLLYEEFKRLLEQVDQPQVRREAVKVLAPVVGKSSFRQLEQRIEQAIADAENRRELDTLETYLRRLDDAIDEAEVEMLLL